MTPLPEPPNGTVLVVRGLGEVNLHAIWRDDDEARDRHSQAGEHWFDSDDTDPMGWQEITRYASELFCVDMDRSYKPGPATSEAVS